MDAVVAIDHQKSLELPRMLHYQLASDMRVSLSLDTMMRTHPKTVYKATSTLLKVDILRKDHQAQLWFPTAYYGTIQLQSLMLLVEG